MPTPTAPPAAAAAARRSLFSLLRLLLGLALGGLFLGALFYVPARANGADVAGTLKGHAARAHLIVTDPTARADAVEYVAGQWSLLSVIMLDIRRSIIIPFLHVFVGFTAFLSAMVCSDRLYHYYVAIYYRYFAKVRPEDKFGHTPLPDMATHPEAYPPVVVQLPMFNEREVCRQVIDAACEMEWPRGRLMVQVLDDSTDDVARERIQDAVAAWREAGVNIVYRWRSNREGYKAGAMSEAMEEIKAYDHCAIFDADFHPDPDFLLKTIPYLVDNPDVGFVQARWTYANGNESLLTRVQEIGLNYHIKCEQYARFASGAFFNFNGTAGVWRRACIEKAGGWNNRTTVEDMDLSLRAYLQGWRFVFLYDVTCLNEVPSSYDAYRKQQHRWSCGPMQLWRKATAAVWASRISWAQKLYLNAFFFGTRMFAAHIVSFVFYCTLVPIAVIAPEVHIPFWALVYMPLLVTLSTVAFTPGGWMHTVAFVLFENAMCVVKGSAMLSGLLELSDAHEWVVTTKLGNWAVAKAKNGLAKAGAAVSAVVPAAAKQPLQKRKIYRAELMMSLLFAVAAVFGISQGRWQYAVFLTLQGLTFAAFGLSCGVDGHKRTCCA